MQACQYAHKYTHKKMCTRITVGEAKRETLKWRLKREVMYMTIRLKK